MGEQRSSALEESVAAEFVALHEDLDAYKRARAVDRNDAFAKTKIADDLNSKISKCNRDMITSIRHGNVGRFLRPDDSMTEPPALQS